MKPTMMNEHQAADFLGVKLSWVRRQRTIGSWMAQKNVSLHTIGRLLNHSSPKVTEVYARLADTTKRDALDDYTKDLLEALKVTPPSAPSSPPDSKPRS